MLRRAPLGPLSLQVWALCTGTYPAPLPSRSTPASCSADAASVAAHGYWSPLGLSNPARRKSSNLSITQPFPTFPPALTPMCSASLACAKSGAVACAATAQTAALASPIGAVPLAWSGLALEWRWVPSCCSNFWRARRVKLKLRACAECSRCCLAPKPQGFLPNQLPPAPSGTGTAEPLHQMPLNA